MTEVAPRVLHLLSQRPLLTGSGVTLDAIVREAAARGWDQHAIVGVPHSSEASVGGLAPERVHALEFGDGALAFDVPGMSDVMPYPSTRFRDMSDVDWARYVDAWRDIIGRVTESVRPDVIHSNHVWAMSAAVKDVAPEVPVVVHCHATGLRQLELCPERADAIRTGVARNERFVVLHGGHAAALEHDVGIDSSRIEVVGAGYRDSVFGAAGGGEPRGETIAYVGKLSAAKGVGPLCDAFERLLRVRPGAHLHVAGSGAGQEGEELRARLASFGSAVTLHGHIAPEELAPILRRCAVFVLPSFYEGLPLVLVEAAASGCRLVATALPGVVEQLAPELGDALRLIDLPEMRGLDTPVEDAVPTFVGDLAEALERALDAPASSLSDGALGAFTWSAVFDRIERVWRQLV